jgi:hypothetical protein
MSVFAVLTDVQIDRFRIEAKEQLREAINHLQSHDFDGAHSSCSLVISLIEQVRVLELNKKI